MRITKKDIFIFLLGAIIFGTTGVLAATLIASDITYDNTNSSLNANNVQDAIDELYSVANNSSSDTACLFLSNQYGQKGQVGSKYACNLGDGVIRNFFILAKDSDNVKLIMEQNLSDTVGSARMDHITALNYLKSGGAGYSTVSAWTKVQSVDLPSAQDIVDASLIINPKDNWSFDISTASGTWWCLGSHEQDQPSGPTYCPTSTAQVKASWLFNYLIDCSSRGCSNSMAENNNYAYGYWTKDLVANNSARAWYVYRDGYLVYIDVSNASYLGVRPVITILKSNLS